MSQKPFEDLFARPARFLAQSIDFTRHTERKIINKKPFKLAEEYWHTLGPGLTTGASDDDPSGIATYSQAGAQYGFQLLWLSWFTFPLMAVVQEMCARIGVVTGKGLAANIREHYPRWVLYVITSFLFASNAFNIGADLGAMAQSVLLLSPGLSFIGLVALFAGISLLLQIFTTYARYARILKYLALVLFAYIFSAFLAHLDWGSVAFYTFVPTLTFTKAQLYLVCAVLGTTISPYLFFWQTAQEVEEKRLRRTSDEEPAPEYAREVLQKEIRNVRTDVWSGMFFSNLVMFFIIAACAGTLYAHGITTITTAADAASALRPFAGNAAFLLFAAGIVGIGMLAIPVLAGSTSYAISESFGWRYGLYRKLKEAYAFYGVIIISMALGVLMNLAGLDPIRALIYSAVVNAFVAPFVLVLILQISSNPHVMRAHANTKLVRGLGWFTVVLMALASVAAVYSFFG